MYEILTSKNSTSYGIEQFQTLIYNEKNTQTSEVLLTLVHNFLFVQLSFY